MKRKQAIYFICKICFLAVLFLLPAAVSGLAADSVDDINQKIAHFEQRRGSLEEMQQATGQLADKYRSIGYLDEQDSIQNLKVNWRSLESERITVNNELEYLYGEKQNAEEKEKRFLGEFRLTAYCPCHTCSGGYGFQTATGVKAAEGITIAVDPRVIPYHTKVYIEGVGYRIAQDCGGAVKQKHIDIFVEDHRSCYLSQYNQPSAKVWLAD
ncbi:3D domain-containing protein [Acetivibrio sp. MSJd-27]|uniref:3D domain-containing protein n=1 Tax=Acetivibrio sp. MSJd-27 TaxID=2841523 RepID=UPI0020A1ABB3|nr:3D domain-containing protein [Acetivibrio sp. MSJd-27]